MKLQSKHRLLLTVACLLAATATAQFRLSAQNTTPPAGELAPKYSSGEYRQVLALPDELMTVIDPNGAGYAMRYQSPAIVDAGFISTKTYSLSWDKQGLGAMRRGAVWYRFHFTLPADVKDKPIGLMLGGYQDEARVWVNGKLVGTSGETAPGKTPGATSAAFDLTEGIDYGGKNLVAIQVVRLGDATTNRTGGLLRPSFLFTGPRLAQKANKPLELRRKLPNGEMGDLIQ